MYHDSNFIDLKYYILLLTETSVLQHKTARNCGINLISPIIFTNFATILLKNDILEELKEIKIDLRGY